MEIPYPVRGTLKIFEYTINDTNLIYKACIYWSNTFVHVKVHLSRRHHNTQDSIKFQWNCDRWSQCLQTHVNGNEAKVGPKRPWLSFMLCKSPGPLIHHREVHCAGKVGRQRWGPSLNKVGTMQRPQLGPPLSGEKKIDAKGSTCCKGGKTSNPVNRSPSLAGLIYCLSPAPSAP